MNFGTEEINQAMPKSKDLEIEMFEKEGVPYISNGFPDYLDATKNMVDVLCMDGGGRPFYILEPI